MKKDITKPIPARPRAPESSAGRHTMNERKSSRRPEGGSVVLLRVEDRDHRRAPRWSAVAGAARKTSRPGGGGAPSSSRPDLQGC